MQWLAGNASTVVVLILLIAVVAAIVRSLVRNRGKACEGCSGDCSGCGEACATCTIELTQEQLDKLDALTSNEGRGL